MKKAPSGRDNKSTDYPKKDFRTNRTNNNPTDRVKKEFTPKPSEIPENEESYEDKIEGRNPVIEALKAGRQIDKIMIQKGEREGSIISLIAMAKEKRIIVQEVERPKLDQISTTHSHQGVIAFAAMVDYVEVEDILQKAKDKEEPPFVIIVDEVTDPHNLGSILRTANAAGAHGVIIPKRRSVGMTGVVAKTSAGAIEYVPVARVSNLAQTIDKLKEAGLWIVGADMSGTQDLYAADLKGSIGLVIGSEGEGIGRLIKEKCDFLVRIPMKGEIASLNASVAASVLMYEVVRQRG